MEVLVFLWKGIVVHIKTAQYKNRFGTSPKFKMFGVIIIEGFKTDFRTNCCKKLMFQATLLVYIHKNQSCFCEE